MAAQLHKFWPAVASQVIPSSTGQGEFKSRLYMSLSALHTQAQTDGIKLERLMTNRNAASHDAELLLKCKHFTGC